MFLFFTEQVLSVSSRQIASILGTSTTEAELISAASCPQGVAFYRKLADELGSSSGRLNQQFFGRITMAV